MERVVGHYRTIADGKPGTVVFGLVYEGYTEIYWEEVGNIYLLDKFMTIWWYCGLLEKKLSTRSCCTSEHSGENER